MCTPQHRGHDWHFAVPIQGTCHDSRVVRLDISQADSLASVLSRAIQNEPNFKYLIPDEQARRTILPWFLRAVAIRACHAYGEIYTTPTIDGGALWIGPGHTRAFEQMVRREMLAMPFNLGWTSFRRYVNLAARLEPIRTVCPAISRLFRKRTCPSTKHAAFAFKAPDRFPAADQISGC
jgi:hypothetical protein